MPIEFPAHAPSPWFTIADGCLTIGGRPLTEIAAQAGRTPFYVYDRAVMSGKVEELRRWLPRAVHLHYAMKANPMPAVVRHMVGLVDGVDVASAAEMDVALAAGATPETVSFAGPGKSEAELERAVAAGITINIESEREISFLGKLGRTGQRRPRVAVRVNPDFELNQPRFQGATILLGRANFGCGSSREHAPWALLDYGFRVIIAPSFADIFYNNCFKNGMLPITLSESQIEQLFQRVRAEEAYELSVDLDRQWISDDSGLRFSFDVDPFRRECLLKGLDDIGMTLQHADKISEYESHKAAF